MKSIVMPSTVQLNEEEKNELTQEVEETVATEAINNKNETFTVSQMDWLWRVILIIEILSGS